MVKCQFLAMLAGALGALASVTGKLGMDESYTIAASQLMFDTVLESAEERVWALSCVLRAVLLALTLFLNGAMWGVFVESMQGLKSGEAIVLNTATNILVSAFCGWIGFGETFGLYWWVGAGFILCGIAILKTESGQEFGKGGKVE